MQEFNSESLIVINAFPKPQCMLKINFQYTDAD